MNNKGFTLVELLAVIVIISLLGLLTGSAVTKLVKDSRNDLYNNQISLIIEAAKAWGADNIYRLPDNNNCLYITLLDLQEANLIGEDIIDSKTNKQISSSFKVYIRSNINTYGKNNITYDVDENNASNTTCTIATYICTASTDSNKTLGNVPSGDYTAGDEYICNVNGIDEYHFFVLNSDTDNVNLIMDNDINLDGSIATISRNDTVLFSESSNFVLEATKEWTNIPINTDNARARLPLIGEVASRCGAYSCPSWLTVNIKDNYLISPNGGTNGLMITSSGLASNTEKSHVRPVIVVPKSKIIG